MTGSNYVPDNPRQLRTPRKELLPPKITYINYNSCSRQAGYLTCLIVIKSPQIPNGPHGKLRAWPSGGGGREAAASATRGRRKSLPGDG